MQGCFAFDHTARMVNSDGPDSETGTTNFGTPSAPEGGAAHMVGRLYRDALARVVSEPEALL